MNCPTCGRRLHRKKRWRLFAGGLFFIVLAIAEIEMEDTFLLLFAFVCLLIAAYLIFWATYAKGLWCRTCNRFPLRMR